MTALFPVVLSWCRKKLLVHDETPTRRQILTRLLFLESFGLLFTSFLLFRFQSRRLEYYVKDGIFQRQPSGADPEQQDSSREQRSLMGLLALDAIVFVYTLFADAKVRRQIRDVQMSIIATPGALIVPSNPTARTRLQRRHQNAIGKLLFRFLMIHDVFVNAIPISLFLLLFNHIPIRKSTFLSGIAICNTLTHCLMLPVLSPRFRMKLVQSLWRCVGRKKAISLSLQSSRRCNSVANSNIKGCGTPRE